MIRVSIGMPVYNGEKFIRKALDSLLAQKFTDFEILISDNASTDATRNICEEYRQRDARIKYIRQEENIGPVENFKFVYDNTTADYFMFAAVDDLWNENYIDHMCRLLDYDEDAALAFSDFEIKNIDGDDSVPIDVSSSLSKSPFIRYMIRLFDMQPHLIYGLFRRKYFQSTSFEKFDFFDVQFGLSIVLQGKIRVANARLYSWGVKQTRESYSIKGKTVSHLPFYLSQLKISWGTFNPLKALMATLVLTYWLLNNSLRRILSPGQFSIDFRK